MSQVITYQRFWQRRGTDAEWAAANPVLHAGEIGVVQDPGGSPSIITRIKVGDGIRAWLDLPWFGIGALEDPGYNAVPFWDTANNRYELRSALPADVGGTGFSNYNVGDLLYASAAGALSKLSPGTVGYNLTSGGPGAAPFWSAGGAGAMALLGTATVAGSAATVLTLSGLDLSAYKAFRVILNIKNATASNTNLSLYFNADTTAGNYDRETFNASGAGTNAARGNDAIIVSVIASALMSGELLIVSDKDGKARTHFTGSEGVTTGIIYRSGAHAYRTATNVTGITISSSVASALAVGSSFSVWGLN